MNRTMNVMRKSINRSDISLSIFDEEKALIALEQPRSKKIKVLGQCDQNVYKPRQILPFVSESQHIPCIFDLNQPNLLQCQLCFPCSSSSSIDSLSINKGPVKEDLQVKESMEIMLFIQWLFQYNMVELDKEVVDFMQAIPNGLWTCDECDNKAILVHGAAALGLCYLCLIRPLVADEDDAIHKIYSGAWPTIPVSANARLQSYYLTYKNGGNENKINTFNVVVTKGTSEPVIERYMKVVTNQTESVITELSGIFTDIQDPILLTCIKYVHIDQICPIELSHDEIRKRSRNCVRFLKWLQANCIFWMNNSILKNMLHETTDKCELCHDIAWVSQFSYPLCYNCVSSVNKTGSIPLLTGLWPLVQLKPSISSPIQIYEAIYGENDFICILKLLVTRNTPESMISQYVKNSSLMFRNWEKQSSIFIDITDPEVLEFVSHVHIDQMYIR